MGGGERACRVVSGGENVALRHKMKGTNKMSKQEIIKIFGDRKIRSVWDDEAEIWYFSIVDVVAVLTESKNPANYWKVLKNRLKKRGKRNRYKL